MANQSIERQTLKLPPDFDQRRHENALKRLIQQRLGEGFEIDLIDPVARVAHVSRQSAITEIVDDRNEKHVNLPRGVKPADGDRIQQRYEDANPGFTLTVFEPFLGRATMRRLTDHERNCRDHVAAEFGVKPWEVQVTSRPDGGFDLKLTPRCFKGKYAEKLEKVATENVGGVGWFVRTDPGKLTASIIPSDPPTFPPVIAAPLGRLGKTDHNYIPIGMDLPAPGQPEGREFTIGFGAAAYALVGGIPQSGKLQSLDSRIPVPVSDRYPTGWAFVGQMRVGDVLYTPDGGTALVVGFSDTVVRELYDVHLSDGQVVRVGGEHLWRVSDARSRRNDRQRGTEDLRAGRNAARNAEIARLREKSRAYPAGTYGTVQQIADLAGVPAARVYRAVHDNDISREELHLAAPTPTKRSCDVVRYDADAAAGHLRTIGLGTALLPVQVEGRWATAKEIAIGIGLGSAPSQARKVARRLQAAGVATQTRREQILRRASTQRRVVSVYPIGETISLLADAYTVTGALMPLEKVVSTDQMRSTLHAEGDERTNWAIHLPEPFDTADADLPIDPYLLGAWLGDGTARAGAITCGSDDLAAMTGLLSQAWDGAVVVSPKGERAHTLRFPRPDPGLCIRGHDEWNITAAGARYCRACRRRGGPVINTSLGERLALHGLRGSKRIPAVYLRASRAQRLALLQGLMDTDGTIGMRGGCELTLCDGQLVGDVVELLRSLSIKVRVHTGDATITQATAEGGAARRVVGTRWRMSFVTSQDVFRLERKRSRLPVDERSDRQWLYVTDIVPAGRHWARCLRVNSRDGLYLTEHFVPTHNSVSLNAIVAFSLGGGSELVVVDTPDKAVDFMWCRDMVRPSGWGCESLRGAVTALALVYEEGQRRAAILKRHQVVNWTQLPDREQFAPILVVVDEYAALVGPEKIPAGIPKTHPLVIEALETNLLKAQIERWVSKITAEMRFVGIRMVISSQVTNANTGLPPSLKAKLGHRLLLGANPSKAARSQAFNDPDAVPAVPEAVRADERASRGVGGYESEGRYPSVFKSYYASTDDYRRALLALGVPRTDAGQPTPTQIAKHTPSLDDTGDDARPGSRLDSEGGWGERDGRDAPAPRLRGAAAAAHGLRVEAERATRHQAADGPAGGVEVT